MAANVSQRRRRTAALSQRLREIPGWRFELRCTHCKRDVVLPVSGLRDELLVYQVLQLLACRRCGRPPGAVTIGHGQGRRAWSVKLTGPGSFG